MTAGTMTGQWQPGRPNIFPKLIAIMLLAVIAYGTHAVAKHGNDATRVRQCMENQGPNQIWQSMSYRTPNKFYLVCEIEPGYYGMQIIERTKNGLREKTSFIIKNGKLQEVQEYLTARASQLNVDAWSLFH